MKKLSLIFFLVGIITAGQSQDFWKGLSGPYGGVINDIVSTSAGVMLASTPNGIYRTTNSGSTWTKVSSGTDNSFSDLEIDPTSSGTKIFASTPGGARIYVSTDGGVTWSLLSATGILGVVSKIKVASNGTTIYLVDVALRLMKSTDSGATFSNVFTFSGTTINDLDLDPSNNIYVSTFGQGIKVSTTSGASFTTPSTGSLTSSAVVYSTVINGSGAIFCLSSNGAHKSTNIGVSYAAINTGLVDATYSGLIDLDGSGNIFLCNNDFKKIYTTTAASGGASWSYLTSPFWALSATAMFFESGATFYLGLNNIGVTKFASSTWTTSSIGIKALQTSTASIQKLGNTLLATGSNLGYFSSTNDGANWTLDANGVTNRNIVGFVMLSDNSFLGYGNGVIRLPGEFSSWNLQSAQVLTQLVTSNGINLFSFTGTSLLSSSNQGVNWTTQPITGLPGTPNAIQVDAANNIYFSFSNEIYKVNTGTTTAAKVTALTATSIQDFEVVSNSLYVLGNTNTLFVSDNNGTSFISKNAPATSSAIWVHDSKYMFLRTTLNNFFVSKDGGGIWTNQPLLESQATVTDAFVSDDTYLYVATTSSVINKSLQRIIPPAAPTNLITIGKTYDRVELMWTDNANNEDNFILESSVGNNTNYATVDLGVNIGIVDGTLNGRFNVAAPGLVKNTLYFFRIKATNGAGSSPYSNEISVTTLDKCTTTIPNNRSWTAVATADPGSTASGPGPFTNTIVNIVADLSNPNLFTTTDFDMGISPVGTFGFATIIESCGQVYNQEYNTIANGNGTWNGTNTIVMKWQDSPYYLSDFQGTTTFTLNSSDPAPATPTLNAYLYSGTEILLNWNSIAYATQYDIERGTVSGGPYTPIATVNYPAVTYLDKNLTTGSTYYYRVRSKNTVSSGPSSEAGIALQNGLFRPVENAIQLNFENQQGVSWGDIDGDGDEDIASPSFTNNAGQSVPPVFYENMGNGKDFTRRDLTALQSENTAVSRGINLFDFNNDGKLDMYICRSLSPGKIADILLINEGNWSFTKELISSTDLEAVFRSSAAADYDQDGLVDIFVGNGNAQTLPDLLLKNASGSSLLEITSGALTTDLGDSRNVSWIDYDNDNDQDMFVLNSTSSQPHRLYKNNGNGTFTRVTGLVFDSDIMAGARTVSWGDIDNDGDFDLYIGSQSASVAPSATDRVYQNNGNGTFTSIGGTAGESGTATFGSTFGDIDNDGDLDLIAINSTANSIFLNNGAGTFTKYSGQEMANHPTINEIGGALADYDKDGFLDFYPSKGQTTAADLPNFLYRNLMTPSASRNWIELKLVGTLSNKAGIGARVTVTTTSPARTQIREVSTRTGYGSANSLIVHVGLGSATTAGTTIQIKWPSGFIQTITSPTLNQVLTVTEDVHADLTFTPPSTLDSKFVTTTFSTGATVNFGSLAGVKLFYREISGEDFTELAGIYNAGTTKWDFDIQRNFADANGLEYYLTAQVGSNSVGRLPVNPATNFYTYLNYQEADNSIPAEHIGLGGTKNTWKIFSIPFDLGSNNNVNAVFDELDGLVDKVDWRMISYKNATAWGQFPEDFSTLARGKGYFINIKNSVDIKIPAATASANNRKTLFQMVLKTGWNQIGNPYLTPISWADVVTLNSLTGTVAQLKTFSGGAYNNATTLDPFEGGFVLAQSDMTIAIPFQGQTAVGGRKANTNVNESDWILPITLVQDGMENNFGGVGMQAEAQASFDEFDDFNAPRFIDFIEMNFEHPEHFVKQFSRDVVPTQQEYVWDFSVESNLNGEAKLQWNQPEINGNDLYLFDGGTQTVINMREVSSHSFEPSVSKNFKIYFGKNIEEKILPNRILFAKAYPNPTAQETIFNYTLADGKKNYRVNLEVFDLMGRKVATLAQGSFEPGFYSTSLNVDQHELQNGMYTCRLQVVYEGGHQAYTQKIVIKK